MQAQLLQVPFSASWSREIISDQDKFTPEMLLDELQEQDITVSLQHILTQLDRLNQVCYSQMISLVGNYPAVHPAGWYGDRLDKL